MALPLASTYLCLRLTASSRRCSRFGGHLEKVFFPSYPVRRFLANIHEPSRPVPLGWRPAGSFRFYRPRFLHSCPIHFFGVHVEIGLSKLLLSSWSYPSASGADYLQLFVHATIAAEEYGLARSAGLDRFRRLSSAAVVSAIGKDFFHAISSVRVRWTSAILQNKEL